MNYAKEEAIGKLGEAMMAKREKTWDECGIEEKVERLRQQLRNHRDMSGHTYRRASEAHDLAQNHQHSPTGEVLKPARERGGAEQAGGSGYDPLR